MEDNFYTNIQSYSHTFNILFGLAQLAFYILAIVYFALIAIPNKSSQSDIIEWFFYMGIYSIVNLSLLILAALVGNFLNINITFKKSSHVVSVSLYIIANFCVMSWLLSVGVNVFQKMSYCSNSNNFNVHSSSKCSLYNNEFSILFIFFCVIYSLIALIFLSLVIITLSLIVIIK